MHTSARACDACLFSRFMRQLAERNEKRKEEQCIRYEFIQDGDIRDVDE